MQELENDYEVVSDSSTNGRIYKHYVFTFYDRSFECVASGLTALEIKDVRNVSEILTELQKILESEQGACHNAGKPAS